MSAVITKSLTARMQAGMSLVEAVEFERVLMEEIISGSTERGRAAFEALSRAVYARLTGSETAEAPKPESKENLFVAPRLSTEAGDPRKKCLSWGLR